MNKDNNELEQQSNTPENAEQNFEMRPPDERPYPEYPEYPEYPPDDPPIDPPPTGDQFSPTGHLDSADGGYISGWSYDPDNSSASNDVHIYIGGPAGSGASGFGVTANQSRPDVNQAFGISGDHGYSFPIPSQYATGQQYAVYAYGIDTGANSPQLLQGSPKYFVLSPPAPAVELNQISPIAGSIVGGLSVTLTGNGFQPGATVYFGSIASSQVTFESSSVIHAVVPAASTAGSVSVAVYNPDGSNATVQGGFTYVSTQAGQQAEVVGISPLTVLENTQTELTIRGRNLIQAYNSGVFALRGPSRCQITFLNTTTSHDSATGLDTIKVVADIQCTPALQPLERLAIQVLASTRPESANDGIVQTSKQMFTVLPKSVPVPLAYTGSLTPDQPNLVMVSGRNLDGYQLSADDGTKITLQASSDKFVSGLITLPENYDTSQPLQLSVEDPNGVKVHDFAMEVSPLMQSSRKTSDEYMSLTSPQEEMPLSFMEFPGQMFIGPTENDFSVFSLNSIGWGGSMNWSYYKFTIVDVTIILPIVNEVYLLPNFDGGDELNSPVVAQVGGTMRLRGAGLLVVLRVEVRIRIRVAVIIGFYTYIWTSWGFWNEFPEIGWGVGSVVLGFEINVNVIFNLAFLLALVKPSGEMVVLTAYNLSAGIDFQITNNGIKVKPNLPDEKTYKPYIIGISPKANEPNLCGNKFALLSQNGQAAVSDGIGFVANYAVNEAGNCCLPWDYDVQVLGFSANEQPEVIQAGFQTTYCIEATQPPTIEIEPKLAYLDSNGDLVGTTEIERYEPHETQRQYVLAAKITNPSVVTSNGAYAVKFNVMMKTEDSGGNLIANPLAVPNVNFPSPRDSQENDLKKFFSGNLANTITGGVQNNGYKYSATLGLNVTTANKNDLIAFTNGEIFPNQKEETGKFVPPGKNVTGNKISLNFEMVAPTSSTAGYVINSNNKLTQFVANEETYEEYYRVFNEIRAVLHTGNTNIANLANFAGSFQNELKTNGLSNLQSWGKNLWDFGVSYVQNITKDDRPLYYARLEALAVLRTYGKRKPTTITNDNLKLFEWSSRGLTLKNGKFEIEFVTNRDRKVVVTGFDPYQLYQNADTHNPAGSVALGLNGTDVLGNSVEVKTAVLPVNWTDFSGGTIEDVMKKGVQTANLIVTCSAGNENFRIDRFATRTRVTNAVDNANKKAVDDPNNTSTPAFSTAGPFYLESTLPYESPNVLEASKIVLSSGSLIGYVVLDQSYNQPDATPPRNAPDRSAGHIDTYKKSTNIPDTSKKLAEGSGGDYLSNEIFYRTANVRNTEKPVLPTGHLHIYGVFNGSEALSGATEVIKSFLSSVVALNFEDTVVGVERTGSVTIFNTSDSNIQINSHNMASLPDFELIDTLPILIDKTASKTLQFKFKPTGCQPRNGIVQLKSGANLLFSVQLSGNGIELLTAPDIQFDPLTVNTADIKQVTISNPTCNPDIVITNVTVDSPFSLIEPTSVSLTTPLEIKSGQNKDVRIEFRPPSAGIYSNKKAVFTDKSGNIVLKINLNGEGQSTPPPPTISPTSSAFNPSSGTVGSSFTVSGQNFTGATSVKIGGVSASFTVDNDNQITVTVPSGATSSTVEVVTPGGGVTSSAQFTVLQPPVIYTYQPSSGGPYSTVTIYGENLDRVFEVRMGGTWMYFNINGPTAYVNTTHITATVPSMSAGQYLIELLTPDSPTGVVEVGYFYVTNEYGGWQY